MFEIYMNGAKINWKKVVENYGTEYANELKIEIKMVRPYTTITSEDGSLEIFVY